MSATIYFPQITVPKPGFLGGENWELSNLPAITVLFGKNGSGKSLLLRAWRDLQIDGSHYVIPERTGSLNFEARFLQEQVNAQQRRNQATRNFLTNYRETILARIQAYFIARGATRGGQLVGDPGDLEDLLSTLLPDFTLQLTGGNPPYVLRRVEQPEQDITDIDQLSSGEAQLLTIALDVLTIAAIWDLQQANNRLLLIDEPDAHIHPDLQARFADFLTRVADKYNLQLVVATHSTTLLSAIGQFSSDDCGVIYFDRTKNAFEAQRFTSALKELAACLGGHALMGPLFGAPILLVEGDDDYRIWSQVPRHHIANFSVIPCHGEEIFDYQESLEKVFSALRDDNGPVAGFTLLDGDKVLPKPSANNPQNHIRFMGLSCHEAENLYLTDEVLAQIGTTWPEAHAKIIANAAAHGNKEASLLDAPNWDRKTVDIKELINEVSLAIDPKHVHWTQRVGTTLGRVKPVGQVADFLGTSVVEALWST